MITKHLYGLDYAENEPPSNWEALRAQATVSDDANEVAVNPNVLTWKGAVVELFQVWGDTYGVSNSMPYKIIVNEGGDDVVFFDGAIRLLELEELNETNPKIVSAPIFKPDDNDHVFKKIEGITQGLLATRGVYTVSDYIDCPVRVETKKGLAQQAMIITQLGYSLVTSFTGLVQNLYSALSDIIGLSIAVGIVEMSFLLFNAVLEIQIMIDSIIRAKDLFYPLNSYYKVMSYSVALEKAFGYIGYDIDFGIIKPVLDKTYLVASQYGFSGYPTTGVPFKGELKSRDFGYAIGEMMQDVETMFYTRQDVRDGVVHLKAKIDPFWSEPSGFEPENILFGSTKQQQNGVKRYDLEELKSTWFMEYITDNSDSHTLTKQEGNLHEVHRESIIEGLDPRLNSLSGIDLKSINHPIAVRKELLDNLEEEMSEAINLFNLALENFNTTLEDEIDSIVASVSLYPLISDLLAMPKVADILTNFNGALKIEDNAFQKSKIVYLERVGSGYAIPANFKDIIGAPALYNKYYKPFSPGDVSGFAGQYTLRLGWRIPFTANNFVQTKNNPYYDLDGKTAKFTLIDWALNSPNATTDSKVQEPFDKKIKETEL